MKKLELDIIHQSIFITNIYEVYNLIIFMREREKERERERESSYIIQ